MPRRSDSRSPSREDHRRSPPRRRRSRSDSYDRRRRYSRSPRPRRRETREEEINPGNNLYVSNLSYETKERDLEELFSKHGALKETRIVNDPYTKESRGFGFVTFERNEDAEEAIRNLDKTDFAGRVISIQRAKRSKPHAPTPGGYLGPIGASSKYKSRRSPSPCSRRRSRSRSNSRGRR
jgi:transformer-2 protein